MDGNWVFLFGIFSIVATILNVVFVLAGKDSRIFMFAGLSFTALTICAAYAGDLRIVEGMGADRDLMFTPILFGPVVISILINSIGLFGKRK